MAMDDVRFPAEFTNGFKDAPAEEERTLIIVRIELVGRIVRHRLALEIFFIVDEVHLHPGAWHAGHLDQEGMVRIVDDQVHPAQADHLMQLVAALVDAAELRHEHTDLVAPVEHALRQLTGSGCHLAAIREGVDELGDSKDLGFLQTHCGKGEGNGSTKV